MHNLAFSVSGLTEERLATCDQETFERIIEARFEAWQDRIDAMHLSGKIGESAYGLLIDKAEDYVQRLWDTYW